MTTTTDRAAELRAEIEHAEQMVGAHFDDIVQRTIWAAKVTRARRELEGLS